MGHAKALFADEISTGLDSNTTHTIVKTLRNYCHVMQVGARVAVRAVGPGWQCGQWGQGADSWAHV